MAQNSSSVFAESWSELPKDPRAILALAELRYPAFGVASRPWYFRASYQLYDKTGQPTEKGTVDYWWVSPKVYRETWIQGGSTLSVWHTEDGKRLTVAKGEEIRYFVEEMPWELLEPLPQKLGEDRKGSELRRDLISFGNLRLPCVRIFGDQGELQQADCFDSRAPVLLVKAYPSGIQFQYGDFVKVEGRDFPRSVTELVKGQKLLVAKVETIGDLRADAPALQPPPDARTDGLAYAHGAGAMHDSGGPTLQYPFIAKEERLQGAVIFEARIGKDGRVQDLELMVGPGPVLEDEARKVASQWRFKPFQENGQAVPVRAEIEFIFALPRR
jgi:TonB family protein